MNIIPTIMIGNMEIEFPAIHIMNRFIGICLIGPKAISQDFWIRGKKFILEGNKQVLQYNVATNIDCLIMKTNAIYTLNYNF